MPWTTNSSGLPTYKPSNYIKEDLPTWNEIYECYQHRMFHYNPEEPNQKMIHYWNIPERMYYIGTVCNQFNKMLFEDDSVYHMKESIHALFRENVLDVRWICTMDLLDSDANEDELPIIYTLPFDTDNPFLRTSKAKRTQLNQINGEMDIIPQITVYKEEIMGGHIFPVYPEGDVWWNIIEIMMKPIRTYFENGIGWKDQNGNLIQEKQPTEPCDYK